MLFRSVESVTLLTEKRDGTVKGRMVYNGKPTRAWIDKEDKASPTVTKEEIFLTGVIDALEERDIMSCDIPNAFVQAKFPKIKPGEDQIIMQACVVL